MPNPLVLSLKNMIPAFLFFFAVVMIFRFSEELITNQAKLIIALAYIGVPFGMALCMPIYSDDQPYRMVLYFFVIIWTSDSFAYFVGKNFGKTYFAKTISKKKTVEGLLGGIVGSIMVSLVINIFDDQLRQSIIIPGILIGIFAPIGDLTQSKLKRIFKVKDSGRLLPGHGGFLDRLDSFIFVVPILYLFPVGC